MNREKAEKLLAALLFDDLDASSKAELTAYLQTDDELRERLADMRMAVKVTSDALQNEPERMLDKKRLDKLSRLANKSSNRSVIFTMRRLMAAAAVLAVIALPALFIMPSLQKAKVSMDLAGGTSVAYELSAREPIPVKSNSQPSEETSMESKKQIAQVSDFENPYSDSIPGESYGGSAYGGAYFAEGQTVNRMGGRELNEIHNSVAADRNRDVVANAPEDSLRRGGDLSVSSADTSGPIFGSGLYSFGGHGTNGPDSGVTYEDYASSVSDSSARADEFIAKTSISNCTVNNDNIFSATTPRPEPSDNFSIGGDRGALTDSISDNTRSYYYRYQGDSPVINGRLILDGKGDGIDAPAGGAIAGGELSLHLKSLGELGSDDRATVSRRKPAPAPVTRPNRIITGNEMGASLTETPPAAKPASPTQPVPGALGGGFAVNVPQSQVQDSVKSNAEAASEIGRLLQNQTDGDVTIIGRKFNNERPVRKGSELSKEGLETIKLGTDDYDGDAVEEDKAKVPILGDLPLMGGLYKSESTKDTADKEYARKEIEAVAPTEQVRKSMEAERAKAVSNYMDHALSFQKEQRYEESLGQLEQVLAIDPQNQKAKILKQTLEHTQEYTKERKLAEETGYNALISTLQADEKAIPYSEEINYPRNWKEISERREASLRERFDVESLAEDISDLPLASRFKSMPVNPWVMTERDALSTFALDVDTASYTLCRRYIHSGFLPPAGAVRMEEFINYFNYQYPQQSDRTFRVYTEAAASPFAGEGKNLTLLKIGVKARTLGRDQQKPAHLVFVIDTSASMGQPERLPLIQQALNLLIDRLTDADHVTLITCSDQARLLLDTVPVSRRERIRQVINAVQPSGTTNLLAGLQLGYTTARRSYSARQVNQIILCSDGVANVGQTEAEAVLKAVAQDRKQGITMTCVGVGFGTYNDAFMESLADQGDGRYVYLDSLRQTQRVFVEQLAATLHTVAKDSRIQVSFNPERVRRYRLIGYENRDIEDARFRDDTIDAGEVGSGQCSTALYELELINSPSASQIDDLGTVFVRYRNVDTDQIEEISCDLENTIVRTRTVEDSPYFYLAAAAAQFAEILRQSEHVQDRNLTDVRIVAEKVSSVLDLDRDVRELAELIRRSEGLPRAQ